jgi:hypothetical protein
MLVQALRLSGRASAVYLKAYTRLKYGLSKAESLLSLKNTLFKGYDVGTGKMQNL